MASPLIHLLATPALWLPARVFATPVTAQADIVTMAFDDRLSLRNGLTFTDGYRCLRRDGKDAATGLDRYKVEKQDNTPHWDVSARVSLLAGDHSPYIGMDVINVTDSSNIVSNEAGVQLFGIGRQYWLEVGYEF